MENINEITSQFLTFVLGQETFAIEVSKATEVIEVQRIINVPCTPDFMKGIINLRGDIVPIVNIRLKLNIADKAFDENTVIIILKLQREDEVEKLGIIADQIKNVQTIPQDSIQKPPEVGNFYDRQYITGLVTEQNNYLLILDIENILTINHTELTC